MYSTCILCTLFVAAKITSANPSSASPTAEPTAEPTLGPSDAPSTEPSVAPTTDYPTYPTISDFPTPQPTINNGEIECGEILNVQNEDFRVDVPWNETKIFSFTNEEEQSVVFSNCGSYGDTYMKLYDSDWNDITNQSVGGCNGNDCTGGNTWNGSYFSCTNDYEYVWNGYADENDGNLFGGSATKETFAMANLAAGEYYLLVGWTDPDAMKNVTTYTIDQVGWYGNIPVTTNTPQDQISPVFVVPLCFNDCENVYYGSNWWGGTDHWDDKNWEWCPSRYETTRTATGYPNDTTTTERDSGDEGSRLSAVVAMATLCVIGLFTM